MKNFFLVKNITYLLVTCLSLLSISVPALANQRSEETNEIIVTGKKKKMDEFRSLIISQFNLSGGGRHDGQYARFAHPVCPSVAGLSDAQIATIEKQIRQTAKTAEIRVGKEKCSPNIFVAIVESGSKEIEKLQREKSRLFNSLTRSERDNMAQSGGPTYAWKAIETLTSDSRTNAKSGGYTLQTGLGGLGVITVGGQRSHVKSNLKKSTMEGIVYSYLLIDSKSLQGISTTQIADYAAMVSLIDVKIDADSIVPDGSILSLFSDTKERLQKPQSLSEGDILLLRGLYKTEPNVKASLQRSAILHTMSEELKQE